MIIALVAATWSLIPYSWQTQMDCKNVPEGVVTVDSGQFFSEVIKSKDQDTWQDTGTGQTDLYPSLSHVVVVDAIRSGTPGTPGTAFDVDTFILSQGITAWTLPSNVQYRDYVDDYHAHDGTQYVLVRDSDRSCSVSVHIVNPSYVPPGEGG